MSLVLHSYREKKGLNHQDALAPPAVKNVNSVSKSQTISTVHTKQDSMPEFFSNLSFLSNQAYSIAIAVSLLRMHEFFHSSGSRGSQRHVGHVVGDNSPEEDKGNGDL